MVYLSFVVRKVSVRGQTRNDGGRGEGKNLVRLWFIFARTCPLLNVPKTKKTTTTTTTPKNKKKTPACTKTQFLFIHKNYFGQFFFSFPVHLNLVFAVCRKINPIKFSG